MLETLVLGRRLRLHRHEDGLSYGRDSRRNRADLLLMVGGTSWAIAWRHGVPQGHVSNVFDDPEEAAAALDGELRRRSEE
jgi:hypothetical protein